jgi:FMN reductase
VAARAVVRAGASVELLTGSDLLLPIYDVNSRDRTVEARRFLAAVRNADGLIVAAPSYHGSVSGMVKNALDYVEDLRDGERCYLDNMAVGCVAVGAGWQSAVSTLSSLRTTVHALRGWPTPLGVAVNTSVTSFSVDGGCVDDAVRGQLELMALQVVNFAQVWEWAVLPPSAVPAVTPQVGA